MKCSVAALVSVSALWLITSSTAQADPYRLGVGDVLSITVWNHPELSIEALPVSPDGRVSFPLTGQIDVTGMTAGELETRLEEALRQEMVRPRVSVNIIQARPEQVYVTGAVNQPGPVRWTEDMTALKALGLAGGVLPEVESANLMIVSPDGGFTKLALGVGGAPEEKGALGARVEPGATLIVARAELPKISVLGEVTNPGPVRGTGTKPLTAGEAIALAGGPTDNAALDSSVLVRRNGTSVPLRLASALQGDNPDARIELADGDIIYVPSALRDVAVLGEVNSPGRFTVRQGDTIEQAIAMAQGVTSLADVTGIKVLRGAETLRVDVSEALAGKRPTDFRLLPGDVVVVPSQAVTVTVLGYVNQPGTYELREGARVTEALAAAGGAYPRLGAANRTVLLRGEGTVVHVRKINIGEVVVGKKPETNIEVQSGDIIFVPKISGFSIREIASSIWPLVNLGRLVFD